MPVSLMDSRGLYKTLLISFALIIQQRIKLLSKRKLVFKNFKIAPLDNMTSHLNHSVQLEKLQMQLFKILFENISQPIVTHYLHQQCKCLLLRKLRKKKKVPIDAT